MANDYEVWSDLDWLRVTITGKPNGCYGLLCVIDSNPNILVIPYRCIGQREEWNKGSVLEVIVVDILVTIELLQQNLHRAGLFVLSEDF